MVRLMARVAKTRSNFFLFSFFFNTDFFKGLVTATDSFKNPSPWK